MLKRDGPSGPRFLNLCSDTREQAGPPAAHSQRTLFHARHGNGEERPAQPQSEHRGGHSLQRYNASSCGAWTGHTWARRGCIAFSSHSASGCGRTQFSFRGPRRHSLAGGARVRVLGCARLGGDQQPQAPGTEHPGAHEWHPAPRRGSARRMAWPTSDLGMQHRPVATHIIISDPQFKLRCSSNNALTVRGPGTIAFKMCAATIMIPSLIPILIQSKIDALRHAATASEQTRRPPPGPPPTGARAQPPAFHFGP